MQPSFIFITCQVGAEPAVKAELARKWPAFRFAYSRPGFLTFKIPPGAELADDFDLHSVFARAYGFSLGKVTGATVDECAGNLWQLIGDRPFDRLHVWQRDQYEPGHRGYEPGLTPLAAEAQQAIEAKAAGREQTAGECQSRESASGSQESAAGGQIAPAHSATLSPVHSTSAALPGQFILDCVLVEPNEWWLGYHRAASLPSRWPGGMLAVAAPPEFISRAYFKMEEALAWSRMPLKAGDLWAEIGSAPGGSSQALLGHGLRVIGIDPADMDATVLANPNFTHVKMRGAHVRRREFRNVRCLTADINVAPQYTLDTAEEIVTHPEVNIRGLILTLKLLEWKLADEIPAYLDRIRSWGYGHVRARQLHHNRQEICVAATRKGSN